MMKGKNWTVWVVSKDADNIGYLQMYLSESKEASMNIVRIDDPSPSLTEKIQERPDVVFVDFDSMSGSSALVISSLSESGWPIIGIVSKQTPSDQRKTLEEKIPVLLEMELLNPQYLVYVIDSLLAQNEKESALEGLAEEIEAFVSLFEAFPEALLVIDDKRSVLYANNIAKHLFAEIETHQLLPFSLEDGDGFIEWEDPSTGMLLKRAVKKQPVLWKGLSCDLIILNETVSVDEECNEPQKYASSLQSVINRLPCGIVIANSAHEVLFINHLATHMLGFTQDEVLGAQWDLPFDEEDFRKKTISLDQTGMIVEVQIQQISWKEEQAFMVIMKDAGDQFDQKKTLQTQEAILAMISATAHRMRVTQNLTEEVLPGLADIAKTTGVHHALFMRFDNQGLNVSEIIEWVCDKYTSMKEFWKNLPIERFPWLRSKLMSETFPFEMLPHHISSDVINDFAFIDKEKVTSILFYPVRTKEKLLGLLAFTQIEKEKEWNEQERRMIQIFGNLLSSSIEKKALEKGSLDKEKQNQAKLDHLPDGVILAEAVEGVSSLSIQYINQTLCQLLGYDRQELLQMTIQDIEDPKRWVESHKYMETLMQKGSLIFEMGYLRNHNELISMEVHAKTFATDHKTMILMVFRRKKETDSQESRLQIQLQRMKSLRSIDTIVSSSLDLRSALNLYLDQIIHQLQFDAASIALIDTASYSLEYHCGKGFSKKNPVGMRLRLGESFAGRVIVENRPIMIAHIQHTQNHDRFSQILLEEGFYSYYGIPLIARGEVKGVLEIMHRSTMEIKPEIGDFLEVMTAQLSVAIDNLILIQSLQRSQVEARIRLDQAIEGWSRSIEQRMRKPIGSTMELATRVTDMARVMGIPENQAILIRRGVLLFDLGMVSVGDKILHRKEELTTDQWDVIRNHPESARTLMSHFPYLKELMEIPVYHHERWDGKGYPYGLTGDRIPLSARIFKVMDVAQALAQPRIYREAWREEDIDTYLKEQSGHEFDPDIVDLYFKHK